MGVHDLHDPAHMRNPKRCIEHRCTRAACLPQRIACPIHPGESPGLRTGCLRRPPVVYRPRRSRWRRNLAARPRERFRSYRVPLLPRAQRNVVGNPRLVARTRGPSAPMPSRGLQRAARGVSSSHWRRRGGGGSQESSWGREPWPLRPRGLEWTIDLHERTREKASNPAAGARGSARGRPRVGGGVGVGLVDQGWLGRDTPCFSPVDPEEEDEHAAYAGVMRALC